MPAVWASVGLSALGLGMNFFGGREQDRRQREMAEAQYEQDLLNYQFSWEEGSNHGVFASESDGREIELKHNDIDMVEIY